VSNEAYPLPSNPLEANSKTILAETNFPELGERYQGKVRDVYINSEQVTLITTDRYSAFDRSAAIIPFKGELVNGITRFWFDMTKHIVPNHVIDYPDPNVIIGERCEVLPVEMVIRGYITGSTETSLWTHYARGERNFGDFVLPDGMRKNQKLDELLITPTTKVEIHDRPVTVDEIVAERLIDDETLEHITTLTKQLFAFGQQVALSKGLILVDTKYEFGKTAGGKIVLIDEIHTPDSSRYWQYAPYEGNFAAHREPENFDKEFLRLWFKANCDPYHDEVLPPAPLEKITELSNRYIQVYEQLTDQKFHPNFNQSIIDRIRHNLGIGNSENRSEL